VENREGWEGEPSVDLEERVLRSKVNPQVVLRIVYTATQNRRIVIL
jgi:hypothetical protein